MSDLKDILKGSLARLGVAKQVEVAGIIEKATAEIAKYVPRDDFEVVSLRNGILKVRTQRPVVASLVELNKESILSKQVRTIKYIN